MQVLRKKKKSNYTVIDNAIFKDRDLSLKAKGLLCLMLSLPDGWNFSIKGLTTLSKDGESAVRSTLNELKASGYFTRRQVRKNGKIAKIEYVISETKNCENLVVENPQQENPQQENRTQLNTNRLSTKELNTKECCSSSVNVLKRMTDEETESLFNIYEDADLLIDEVEDDLNRKRKGHEVENMYRYVIGYAENKAWLRLQE